MRYFNLLLPLNEWNRTLLWACQQRQGAFVNFVFRWVCKYVSFSYKYNFKFYCKDALRCVQALISDHEWMEEIAKEDLQVKKGRATEYTSSILLPPVTH